ncbi:uncharacterized protein L201_001221 [Kwoniella dendrophila CBS 6074]|uniref:GATA-type domain-containing protein n=1 Tax=Kwoniella dendrophila CBS 6074 TaxID=1295534 RepID=A0AAX4JNA7_9TREE
MSVRLHRSNADFNPISLPFSTRPQQVNDDGFEVDQNETRLRHQENGTEEALVEDGEKGEDVEEVDQELGADEDVEMENIEEEEQEVLYDVEGEEENDKEPLLSISDSLVLPYSLTQTRHHHLTNLLPHIFSHPSIPSHSKPRAKPPPKGTFVYPTPPPLIHPLPNPEYHGPSLSAEPSQGESSKSQSQKKDSSDPLLNKSSNRFAKSKRANEVEWPAHETECISRCTLTIGPISYPGTEIWIGRFVEPRITLPKKERAKPGEREKKRKLLAEENIQKKPRPKKSRTSTVDGDKTPRRPQLYNKSSTPSSTSTPTPLSNVRPPPPHQSYPQNYRPPRPLQPSHRPVDTVGPSARPTLPPGIRSPGPVPPVRPSTASPHLIQLVNQAALRHAWLSSLIYKAAGSIANQAELERLGKAVARLSRGEPIEDLAPPGAPTGPPPPRTVSGPLPAIQARPPFPSASPLGNNASIPPTAPPSVTAPVVSQNNSDPSTHTSIPTSSQPSSSTRPSSPSLPAQPTITDNAPAEAEDLGPDDDVDMTGRPQVGGGPLPSDSVETPPNVPSQPTSAPSEAVLPEPVVDPALITSDSVVSHEQAVPDTTAVQQVPLEPAVEPSSAPSQPIAVHTEATLNSNITPTPVPTKSTFTSTASDPAPTGSTPTVTPKPTPRAPPVHRLPPIPPFAQPSIASAPVFSTPTPPPPHRLPTPPPPPPPKPTYPLPPPFLLLAFKEQPTEKYLIPLGMGSFVSRIGGDYVTGPRPPTPEPEPEPATQPVQVSADIKVENCNYTDTTQAIDPSTAPANAIPQSTADMPIAAAAQPAVKPSRNRTRQSLGRHAKEAPTSLIAPAGKEPTPPIEPKIPIKVEEGKKPRPTSGLPPLPGQMPPPGTVLISTIVPSGDSRWEKIDWEPLKKKLPFDNSDFWDKNPEPNVTVKQEDPENTSNQSIKPEILNLASIDLMPSEGDVQPVTIRLLDISDEVWQKMKDVIADTEKHAIESMFRNEPKLLDGVTQEINDETSKKVVQNAELAANEPRQMTATDPANPSQTYPSQPIMAVASNSVPVIPSPVIQRREIVARGLSSRILTLLRPTYLARKVSRFTELLKRVPSRLFLQNRVAPPPSQELIDATTDRWAARSYPISTKPLYLPNNDDNDEEEYDGPREIEFSPPPFDHNNNRKSKNQESQVTFELPVSYDLLDERVEQGVKNNLLNIKKRGGSKPGHKSNSIKNQEPPPQDDGKKRYGKRGFSKGICEGCGKENIKVWRKGPTGKGTLCHPCGDLFVNGKLPPLRRPGAMKLLSGEAEAEEDGNEKEASVQPDQEKQADPGNQEQSKLLGEDARDDELEQVKSDNDNAQVPLSPAISNTDQPPFVQNTTKTPAEVMNTTNITPSADPTTKIENTALSDNPAPPITGTGDKEQADVSLIPHGEKGEKAGSESSVEKSRIPFHGDEVNGAGNNDNTNPPSNDIEKYKDLVEDSEMKVDA